MTNRIDGLWDDRPDDTDGDGLGALRSALRGEPEEEAAAALRAFFRDRSRMAAGTVTPLRFAAEALAPIVLAHVDWCAVAGAVLAGPGGGKGRK